MFFEVKNFQALRKAMEELSEYLEESDVPEEEAVSYTHLTLPTKLEV